MKIAFISTFLDTCGIATYTEELAAAMQELGHSVSVFAEYTSTPEPARWEIPYERCWSREDPTTLSNVLAKLSNAKPDVIHIQHEFGLFPDDDAALNFIRGCYEITKTFVTLHTVFRNAESRCMFFSGLQVLTELAEHAVIVVHSPLASAYVPGGAIVVAHGTQECPTPRPALTYGNQFVSTGLFGVNKNAVGTARAFLRATRDWFGCKLVLAGRFTPEARKELDGVLRDWGTDDIEVRDAFQSFAELEELYHQSDYVILNSKGISTTASTSGQAHLAMAHKLPAIYSDSPLYDDIGKWGVGVRFRSLDELEVIIRAIVRNEMTLTGTFCAPTWKEVAKVTVEGLYE